MLRFQHELTSGRQPFLINKYWLQSCSVLWSTEVKYQCFYRDTSRVYILTKKENETVYCFINSFSPLFLSYHWKVVCMCAKLLQLCLSLCDPMDCSPPGSSAHGILQARILEWIAMPSSLLTQGSNPCLLHLLHWQTSTTWEAHSRTIVQGNFLGISHLKPYTLLLAFISCLFFQ